MIRLWARSLGTIFSLVFVCLVISVNIARADVLAEYLFWNSMGNAAGSAVKNYNDYKAQRQLWQKKIAEGEGRLKACGSCPQRGKIEKELSNWKNTEIKFQEFAGQAFVAVGMPRNVAKALGIDMPLTPGMSSAEMRERYKIVRPTWADDRPEFCQQAVDEYIGCLRAYKSHHNTLFTSKARQPGGECYDLKKLFLHCGKENYQAFHAEIELQKKRAAGNIIPEYLDYNNEVYYGEVPADFVPSIPSDIVLEKLKEMDTKTKVRFLKAVRFSMRKKKAGMLALVTIKPFQYDDIDPYIHCGGERTPETEIEHRVCDDYFMLTLRYQPPVLYCQYSKPDLDAPSSWYLDAYKFWYVDPPEYADPKQLLSRSANHPILNVGEARTVCPATESEAEQLQAQWQAKVTKVRLKTPLIGKDVNLPKPEWLIEYLEKLKEEDRKWYEDMKRRGEAIKAFPFEGVYLFETRLDGETTEGRCTMSPASIGKKGLFLLHCQFPGGETTQKVRFFGSGSPHIYWKIGEKEGWLNYEIDESDPNTLVGSDLNHKEGATGRLVRTGDLVPLANFPVDGVYRYERSLEGVTESGQCSVATNGSAFSFHCTSDGGQSFSNKAHKMENTLVISWAALEGRAMHHLVFTVADENLGSQEGSLVLVGRNGYGAKVRLVRTGDLPPEPESVAREDILKRRQEATLKRRQEATEKRRQKAIAKHRVTQPETEEKEQPSKRCKLEEVAGTYRTSFGPLVCKLSGDGLDCCYSSKCKKKVELAFDKSGQNMEGTWKDSRRNGPVIFPVSSECELESGRWNYAGKENIKVWGSWRVKGRMP